MPLLLLYLTGIQNKDALPESVATDVTALSLPPLAIAQQGALLYLAEFFLLFREIFESVVPSQRSRH